jgi:hypothetical protein
VPPKIKNFSGDCVGIAFQLELVCSKKVLIAQVIVFFVMLRSKTTCIFLCHATSTSKFGIRQGGGI